MSNERTPIFDHLRRDHGLTNIAPSAEGMHGQHDGIHGRTWAYKDDPLHHWRWRAEAREAAPDSEALRAALVGLRYALACIADGMDTDVAAEVAKAAMARSDAALAATPASVPPAPALDVLRDLIQNSGIVHEAAPPGIDYMTIQVDPAIWQAAARLTEAAEPKDG